MKFKILSILIFMFGITSISVQASEDVWWRDADDYYKAHADSTDSNFQAVITRNGLNTDNPYIGFRMIMSHKEYCSDKGDKFQHVSELWVNDQKISFAMSCYEKEWLNVYPVSAAGEQYVLTEFKRFRNRPITFVIPYENSPDWIFHFPTKGFGNYYSSLKKSLNEVIQ
ncbi:hypothetical protein ACXJY6_18760 [Vibrio sp. RC27]